MKLTKGRIAGAVIGILVIFATWLAVSDKELSVRMLYACSGDSFDTAAYGQLEQSLVANLQLERHNLDKLTLRQLKGYEAVYLDPSLHETLTDKQRELLQSYVSQGGHLFLENNMVADFPLDFIGAKRLVDLTPPAQLAASSGKTAGAAGEAFAYPQVELNLQGMQQLFRQFMDNYINHDGAADLQQFSWGKGMIPSTAEPMVTLGEQAIYALNRYGKGTVLFSSALLPNRYYITGYDMSSGMDPSLGFDKLAAAVNGAKKPVSGALYFDRNQLPLEPYYHFTFAAAGALMRSEYAAFVSKETLGYSVKKVMGPYGRPAMSHQNHFEAIEAIRDGEGIQWAELLKKYNQVPSFTLVRSSFHWGRWQESLVVHLNEGTNDKPAFHGETPNSFYSSGTRVMADGDPIRLALYPDYRSLGDPVDKPFRAYPALADLNGDGRPDLIVGSADGTISAYLSGGAQPDAYGGQELPAGLTAPDAFGKREPLRLANGQPLKTDAYASVAAYDLNADGRPDLVLGLADGTLAVAYGQAGGVFASPVPLVADGKPIRAAAPVAPALGDVTADGVPDLVVGDADGGVTLYRGQRAAGRGGAAGAGSGSGTAGEPVAFEAGRLLFKLPAKFAAPSIRDMNGDGRADLVVGNVEGDLRIYLQQADGTWQPSGVLEGATVNQLGNHALVGGHNSVPLWYDLNHDGKDDLLVGQLEFGMAIPVDDPKFPYAEQLQAFIQYNKDHYLDLFPHMFVHNFTSDEQEKEEIALQQKSFKTLGIPWNMPGTNQHTWRINNPDRTQTLNNERNAEVWYNFGFRPSNIPNEPRLGVQYNWSFPFLMTDAGSSEPSNPPLLLSTPAPVLRLGEYSTEDLFQSYINLDLPIDYFEHIEYHFPTRVGELLEFVQYLDKIRNQYGYNFMTEPQMARSVLNTLTTRVTVSRPWIEVVFDHLKRLIGIHSDPSIRIQPDTTGVPAQAAEYKGTLGVSIERGQAYAERPMTTDSDVSDLRGDKLYLGVPGKTKVRFGEGTGEASLHMLRANTPYRLDKQNDGWTLELQAGGMQQVQLRSSQPLAIEGDQLQVDHQDGTEVYTVTHFGAAVTVTVRSPKD
ncbi:VCBS repeat-containing protein [Paenibacillus doosanensis]|uniref:FG-GAP repeat domain-containing protein n=1 Tax=Paenibacillus doosanensis TaxID=1229154 RepID=UPI00217FD2B7|nr:VCBS repeat-containing protein [Paenibacillus doosanensis]MCS7459910.1 VCBS repeat-containing protein [Paenibacillus doosanensis]